ncbi:MAG: AAA family ATPase [Nitrospira sp.]
MKLNRLAIRNFRALNWLELTNLTEAVVLAGPNGCGKSCVLDAIRLLKSSFGGYQQNEWSTWFGEFQINLNPDSVELLSMFRDRTLPIEISGDFVLSLDETDYLRAHAAELLEEKAWRDISGPDGARRRQKALATEQRESLEAVNASRDTMMPEFLAQLALPSQLAELRIEVQGGAVATKNLLLEVLFSTYQPQDLGIVDYHGPHRTYNREKLGNVSLTIESTEQRQRASALYNYANKYANLKSEMASAYIRHLIARQADSTAAHDDALTTTLKELFATFFPGKQFLGPRPTADGRLLFPVRVEGGIEHDIDDLSSGEKEVLYGYLRLQNSAPRRSIILIDEPELHLNPRLVSGLAAFYYRHLGKRLDNQLWLVTHSDTLIREAVGQPHFTVFHVHPHVGRPESQATVVKAQQELDRVVMDLVGDLAAYRPGAKVVVFESSSEAAFDVRMTCTLFPDFAQRTNQISGGDKRRVAALHELLEHARKAGHVPGSFFAITDADADDDVLPSGNHFKWDVYHIENYLLVPDIILDALRAVGIGQDEVADASAVERLLRDCADASMRGLVAHRLTRLVSRTLVSAIDLKFDHGRTDLAVALGEAVTRSEGRLRSGLATKVDQASLAQLESEELASHNAALNDGSWLKSFRGRDILKRFAGKTVKGMEYEYFRDLIISKMSERGYRPPGMAVIVNRILGT